MKKQMELEKKKYALERKNRYEQRIKMKWIKNAVKRAFQESKLERPKIKKKMKYDMASSRC